MNPKRPPRNGLVERNVASVKVGRAARPLHAAAVRAQNEAREHLAEEFPRFQAAVERYVNAVEVADAARREWERRGRPLESVGSMGQSVEHPFLRTMERLDRSAAAFGAALGLDPTSARRLAGVSGRGRPVGAVSAVDRVAASRPGPQLKAV